MFPNSNNSGALGGLMQGMVAGRQLHMQMQREAQQQEMARQEMSARDIQNRMLLSQTARPVSEMGTVSDSAEAQTPAPNMPGGAALGPTVSNPISYERKARNVVTYGGQKYELMTPEEQNQRRNEMEMATRRSTGIPVSSGGSDYLQGIGVQPGTFYLDPKEFPQFVSGSRFGYGMDPRMFGGGQQGAAPTSSQGIMNGMLPEAPNPQDMAAPAAKVPMMAAPVFGRIATNAATNATRKATNAATNETRTSTNAATNATREKVAAGAQEGAAKRAADAAATRKTIAAAAEAGKNARKAAGDATREKNAGGEGVQNRFDAKRMDSVQKAEEGYHQTREQVGTILKTGVDAKGNQVTPGTRALLQARFKNATESLQAAQWKKAGLIKTEKPPDSVIAQTPEGKKFTGGDGHMWLKQDGVVYLVK